MSWEAKISYPLLQGIQSEAHKKLLPTFGCIFNCGSVLGNNSQRQSVLSLSLICLLTAASSFDCHLWPGSHRAQRGNVGIALEPTVPTLQVKCELKRRLSATKEKLAAQVEKRFKCATRWGKKKKQNQKQNKAKMMMEKKMQPSRTISNSNNYNCNYK